MPDYIDREAANLALAEQGFDWDKAKQALASVPAADVVPVMHGWWEGYTRSRYIGCDEYGDPRYVDGVVYYCSNPRCRRRTVIKERYCPSCGAKMDGGAIDD